MLEILVGKENADFSSVQEAVNAVPYEEEAVIHIGEGVFCEKVFSEKADITFIGEGMDKTVLEFGDGANDLMPDGSKRGTFRSYTAFFGGKRAVVKNLTIRNTAGDGRLAGQALAVYADSTAVYFENVRLSAHQDTLFCAPLPVTERQKNGFMGPRVMTQRLLTRQYYKNCEIIGDVDFIFGGADAVFDDCRIVCRNRQAVPGFETNADPGGKDQVGTLERYINGYVTAGCGQSKDTGFIFRNCFIGGEEGCKENSVFLGRPWRDEAKAVFINCTMDKSIASERFSGWGSVDKGQPDTFYGEYGSRFSDGSLIDLSEKNSWVRDIDESMALEYGKKAAMIIDFCSGK